MRCKAIIPINNSVGIYSDLDTKLRHFHQHLCFINRLHPLTYKFQNTFVTLKLQVRYTHLKSHEETLGHTPNSSLQY
jgi:hypothetical protein